MECRSPPEIPAVHFRASQEEEFYCFPGCGPCCFHQRGYGDINTKFFWNIYPCSFFNEVGISRVLDTMGLTAAQEDFDQMSRAIAARRQSQQEEVPRASENRPSI